MSDPKNPQRPVWPLPSAPSKPSAPKASDRTAGRVVHDDRGNAVWDWSRAPTDSTTHLLRKLDSPELSLADDAAGKPERAAAAAPGIDAYNKRNDQRVGAKPGAPEPAKPGEPPKDSVLKQLLGKR